MMTACQNPFINLVFSSKLALDKNQTENIIINHDFLHLYVDKYGTMQVALTTEILRCYFLQTINKKSSYSIQWL